MTLKMDRVEQLELTTGVAYAPSGDLLAERARTWLEQQRQGLLSFDDQVRAVLERWILEHEAAKKR